MGKTSAVFIIALDVARLLGMQRICKRFGVQLFSAGNGSLLRGLSQYTIHTLLGCSAPGAYNAWSKRGVGSHEAPHRSSCLGCSRGAFSASSFRTSLTTVSSSACVATTLLQPSAESRRLR